MPVRVFSLSDQISFAKFSGDYNPLHVDKIYSRRSPFGKPVVHGINLLLWSLDCFLEKGIDQVVIKSINAFFRKVIVIGEIVKYLENPICDNRVKINIESNDTLAASIEFEWTKSNWNESFPLQDRNPEKKQPEILGENEILKKMVH